MTGGGGGIIIIRKLAEVVPDANDKQTLQNIADKQTPITSIADSVTVCRIVWKALRSG